MLPERNIRNTREALSHMAGVKVVDMASAEVGVPHHHTTLTIEGEVKKSKATADASDPWGEQRVTKSDDSTETWEIGGEYEIDTEEKVTLPFTPEAPLTPRQSCGPRPSNPAAQNKLTDVVLETEQYSVELQVLGVEVNRPFLILIHGEKPNFSPKGRCKFLAKIDGAQYSVDFLGIQFQIKSHGLYITTFLFEDKQSGT